MLKLIHNLKLNSWQFFSSSMIISTIFAATLIHVHRPNNTIEDYTIDRLDSSLKGMYSLLPPHARLSVRTYGLSTQDYFFCRYLLAWPYLAADKIDYDTIINVSSPNVSDSILHVITDHRKIIWTNKDSNFRYLLTCNN